MAFFPRIAAAPIMLAITLAGCGGATSSPVSPVTGPGLVESQRTSTLAAASASSGASECLFESAPQPVSIALCQTFPHPAGIGNRSGALDGTLWGVSRDTGYLNFGQGQYNAASPTIFQACGLNEPVDPPNDIQICNGRLGDAVTDNGSVTSLAMYPKQPFDIAGRTGTIVFDVSDDSKGNHRVWPELWYTDQPVPDPFIHEGFGSIPRNGFGVRFAAFCPANVAGCGDRFVCPELPLSEPVVTVDSAVDVNNYISNDSFDPVGTISVKPTDCVKASKGPGDMNHFELRVSQDEIDVYGTDAGTTSPLRHLAVITNINLGFTRGLVWLEDAHYNANKPGFGIHQGTHTFTWDNVGFDGPVLPRDLAFDVLDALQPINGLLNLGYNVDPTTTLTLSANGVYNVVGAADALLTFTYSPYNPVTITYRVNNGNWQSQPWPFPACYSGGGFELCGNHTIAVPVPLTDVKTGTNTIQDPQSTDQAAISNVDLVLQGAGGTHAP